MTERDHERCHDPNASQDRARTNCRLLLNVEVRDKNSGFFDAIETGRRFGAPARLVIGRGRERCGVGAAGKLAS